VTVISRERQTHVQRSLVVVFLLQGFISAALIPRVPDIIANIGVSFAEWGVISAFGTVGAASGLFVANRAIERYGVRATTMVSLGAVGIANATLGWLTDSTVFFVVNFAMALCLSVFVIAVNSQTVVLQTLSGRVIIGRFHAAWSAGAAASAALSGFLAGFLPVGIHLTIFSAVGLAVFFVVAPRMLNRSEERIAEGSSGEKAVAWRRMPKRVYLLGIGLAVGVFPEASMWDWSSVYGRDALGFDPARAALPYACFATAMIVGRVLIDVVAKRIPLSLQAAVGGVLAAVSMTVSILVGPGLIALDETSGLVLVSFLWALAGLGTASMAPAFLSSAAIVSGMSAAAALTRMSVMQTALVIALKFSMGASAETAGVAIAMWLPVGSWIAASVVAVIVLRLSRRHHAIAQVSSN
jgi:MFS family permease